MSPEGDERAPPLLSEQRRDRTGSLSLPGSYFHSGWPGRVHRYGRVAGSAHRIGSGLHVIEASGFAL